MSGKNQDPKGGVRGIGLILIGKRVHRKAPHKKSTFLTKKEGSPERPEETKNRKKSGRKRERKWVQSELNQKKKPSGTILEDKGGQDIMRSIQMMQKPKRRRAK